MIEAREVRTVKEAIRMACDVSPVVPYLKPDAELGVLKELKCCEFVEKLFQLDELFRQTVSVVRN